MIDYTLIFDSLPGCYLILSPEAPDFKILATNQAYLEVSGSTHEIIGKKLFEVFPDNPNDPKATGVQNLRESLEAVLNTRRTNQMNIQRYDIQRPGDKHFQIKFWKPLNIPVFGGNSILYIIHSVQDITESVLLENDLKLSDSNTDKLILQTATIARDLERLEISKELHDNISQLLNTSRLYLERYKHRGSPKEQFISEAYGLLLHAIAELKMLSGNNSKRDLSSIDLKKEVEKLLMHVTNLMPVTIIKEIDVSDASRITQEIKLNILRIIQEQISNVLKYSGAQNIEIKVGSKDNYIFVIIEDDGRGFNLSEQTRGMGLKFIRSRIALLGGETHITSTLGNGCKLDIKIPLPDVV